MGFEVSEARLALRSSTGNVERAVQFIQQRKQHMKDARKQSKAERDLHRRYANNAIKDSDWVNPRSVCTLVEMGFERGLATSALRRAKNDVPRALELLQMNSVELRNDLPDAPSADPLQLATLLQLGFPEAVARAALESTHNSLEQATDFLLKSLQSEEELMETVKRIIQLASGGEAAASTSQGTALAGGMSPLMDLVLQKAKSELTAYQAYKRLHADLTHNEHEYLDLPLVREEQLLLEYRKLLEQ